MITEIQSSQIQLPYSFTYLPDIGLRLCTSSDM